MDGLATIIYGQHWKWSDGTSLPSIDKNHDLSIERLDPLISKQVPPLQHAGGFHRAAPQQDDASKR